MASCSTYIITGVMPITSSRAAVGAVQSAPVIYKQAILCTWASCLLTVEFYVQGRLYGRTG